MDEFSQYQPWDELSPGNHGPPPRARRPSSCGAPPRPEKHLRERVRAEREARVPLYRGWLERHPGADLDCRDALGAEGR